MKRIISSRRAVVLAGAKGAKGNPATRDEGRAEEHAEERDGDRDENRDDGIEVQQ